MRITTISLLIVCFIFSCRAQQPFIPVAPKDLSESLIIPPGFSYNIIFSEGDSVDSKNGRAPSKGQNDMIYYMPEKGSSKKGVLYISHESMVVNPVLGDGGGASLVGVELVRGKWENTGYKKNVDFDPVGGTVYNCGGTLTPKGTIVTAEELFPSYVPKLKKQGVTTLKGDGKLSLEENFGWMVEVNPITGVAIQKIRNFGRFTHEDAYFTADGKTVYLTDDHCPAVFFKYESEKPNDYTSGQLFAYQQSKNGKSGIWIPLPMQIDSLVDIRNVAIRRGATMFMRHEWIDEYNGKIYINETGYDTIDYRAEIAKGGTVPYYLKTQHQIKEGIYADPYGRVLIFDPTDLSMKELLAGGKIEKDGGFFSNPDGLFIGKINRHPYLIISEDITDITLGRVSEEAKKLNKVVNEIYFLDATLANPTREDLMRFAIAPAGSETTGNFITPDGKTYFVNIQHPDKTNQPPFNKSTTIAIQGF